ncbi:hypothetical protein [Desulfocurvus vexinensis]|uniref:hypothetical protein n=1 Tax=Desulfocurvus vexinensis TaxID=399548 RepID=UPI00048DAE7F|nr:hypothetical protein [Desulfocurvus vexinensis]
MSLDPQDMTHWPSGLRDVGEIIGPRAALALARMAGGVSYYIPKQPTEGHPFVGVIGAEAFAALCGVYGGDELTVPRGECDGAKKREILRLLAEGLPQRRIALATGATQRYVEMLAAQARRDQPQPRLPGL